MVASVNETQEDKIDNDTSFHFSVFQFSFEMKPNTSETESNWRFRKNVKTRLQNKKSYLMPPSRHGHFHPILILPVKMVELPQQHPIHMKTSP